MKRDESLTAMKRLIAFVWVLTGSVFAAEPARDIYLLRPDGSRDYTKPTYREEGNIIYQQRPDGSRDYTKSAYRQDGAVIFSLRPDGTRDFTKPTLTTKKQ